MLKAREEGVVLRGSGWLSMPLIHVNILKGNTPVYFFSKGD